MASQTRNSLLGLFGGTFDPIHMGHLRTLWEVFTACNLDSLRVLPCASPPHRNQPITSAEHRFKMLQLALTGLPNAIQADDCELNRQGPSYTIDTINYFIRELNPKRICLILGMDAFSKFDAWHRWQDIVQKVHLIVVHRPNCSPLTEKGTSKFAPEKSLTTAKQLRESEPGGLLLQPVTALDISATSIRADFLKNRAAHFLIPDRVLDYIKTHQLYSLPPEDSLCHKRH